MENIIIWAIAGLVSVAIIIIFVIIYNSLIRLRINIDKSIANIEVLLKQRNDEIPRLIDVCKGYMKYEKETYKLITEARTSFLNAKTLPAKAKANNMMSEALKSLFAVAENYPQLKANENFKQLQERVSGLEIEITDRREFYNDSVNIFNARIQQIPYVFLAKPLGYAAKPFFKAEEWEKKISKISFE